MGGCLGEGVGGGVGVLCGGGADSSLLGRALQVAQTASAVCWIVEALRGSGLGSKEGAPTLGEWAAAA